MMKKIFALLLCAMAAVSLASCTKEYVLVEGSHLNHTINETVSISLSRELAIKTFRAYYSSEDAVIYFPNQGEFETRKGEKFTAQVSDKCLVHFVEDSKYSVICFDITIYDENGEIIVEKKNFQSYVQTGTEELDLTYVSEEFKPYWEAIAVCVGAELPLIEMR